jgi:adenylate cyclase
MARLGSHENPAGAAPPADEIRAELTRILAAENFEQATRSKDFLKFVVEESLAGREDRLKGYTIALEVFGREASFDAQSDPLVRVEAGRLRHRLMEYYLGEGFRNPLRVEIPRGGYVPRCTYAPHFRRGSVRERFRAQRLSHRTALLGAIGLIVVVAAAILNAPWAPFVQPTAAEPLELPTRATSDANHGPRLLVMPFSSLSGDRDVSFFTHGLTEEIIQALVKFDVLVIASPPGEIPHTPSASSIRAEFGAGYALAGSVRSVHDQLRITVRLVETAYGTQLWTATYDEVMRGDNELSIQEAIAKNIAMLISSPWGPVYANEIDLLEDRSSEDLDAYECLLRFYDYSRHLDPEGHTASVSCLERVLEHEPDFAFGWAALATLYLQEHTYGYSRRETDDALERAIEAVRTSLDIDGSGRVAAIAMTMIRYVAGDIEGFDRAVNRALSMSPSHPGINSSIGFLLTLAGDGKRGIPLIEEATPLTFDMPGWQHIAYAFDHLQSGKYAAALDAALATDAPAWFVTPMTVAAAAALAGREDIAEREVARLLELCPDFEQHGVERLRRWNMNEPLRAIILDGLRIAGLPVT